MGGGCGNMGVEHHLVAQRTSPLIHAVAPEGDATEHRIMQVSRHRRFSHWLYAVVFLTSASKFNIAPSGGIF